MPLAVYVEIISDQVPTATSVIIIGLSRLDNVNKSIEMLIDRLYKHSFIEMIKAPCGA